MSGISLSAMTPYHRSLTTICLTFAFLVLHCRIQPFKTHKSGLMDLNTVDLCLLGVLIVVEHLVFDLDPQNSGTGLFKIVDNM